MSSRGPQVAYLSPEKNRILAFTLSSYLTYIGTQLQLIAFSSTVTLGVDKSKFFGGAAMLYLNKESGNMS